MKIRSAMLAIGLSLSILGAAATHPVPAQATVASDATLRVQVRAGLQDSNSPIKGAVVTIDGVPGSFVSDANGWTPAVQVSPGSYIVHAEANGWQPVDIEGVTLSAPVTFTTVAYLNKGSGRRHQTNNAPPRTGTQSSGPAKSVGNKPGSVIPLDTPVVSFNKVPATIKACDANGANCSNIDTETLVQYSLWKEWGDATPNYWSTNWPVDSLKAGSVAIRSWLYYNANPLWPPCKHPDCSVWMTQADLTWTTTSPTSTTSYTTALNATVKQYAYYGDFWDATNSTYVRKPISAMFADRTGDPSLDGSKNADGTSNGKMYLASHSSPPDTYVESNRSAGYAPGLSQRGSADWIRGFTGNGTHYQLTDYNAVLQHDYDNLITLDTAQ